MRKQHKEGDRFPKGKSYKAKSRIEHRCHAIFKDREEAVKSWTVISDRLIITTIKGITGTSSSLGGIYAHTNQNRICRWNILFGSSPAPS